MNAHLVGVASPEVELPNRYSDSMGTHPLYSDSGEAIILDIDKVLERVVKAREEVELLWGELNDRKNPFI